MSVQLRAPTPRRRGRAVPERPHPVGDWKIVALRLAGGAVALWGLLSLMGMLVTHVLVHGRGQSMDRGVDVWFAAHRTGVWNSITAVGTGMAQTQTAIAVTVVVVLLLRWGHTAPWANCHQPTLLADRRRSTSPSTGSAEERSSAASRPSTRSPPDSSRPLPKGAGHRPYRVSSPTR